MSGRNVGHERYMGSWEGVRDEKRLYEEREKDK